MKTLSSKRETLITIDIQLTKDELDELATSAEAGYAGGYIVSNDLRLSLREAARGLTLLT